MPQTEPNAAHLVAKAAHAYQYQRTGHAPKAVTVVLSGDTLVITFHGALTPAELALAKDADGIAKVQEYHRHLFDAASDELRAEIKRITGVSVREAAAEIEPATGTVTHAFTGGSMVQVFLLSDQVPLSTWTSAAPETKAPNS